MLYYKQSHSEWDLQRKPQFGVYISLAQGKIPHIIDTLGNYTFSLKAFEASLFPGVMASCFTQNYEFFAVRYCL